MPDAPTDTESGNAPPPDAVIARPRTCGRAGPWLTLLHGGPVAPGHMAPVARALADDVRILELFARRAGATVLSVALHLRDVADAIGRHAGTSVPLGTSRRKHSTLRRAVACTLAAGCCISIACSDAADRGATRDPPETNARELVVLVHGMGRTPLSMVRLERDLEDAGYRVMNWGYSSYCCTIAELGRRLRADLDRERGDAQRVHFVGHSLGNILIRWVLTRPDRPADVGRVVMLAPPNRGSSSADRYARWLGGVLKPLPELTTDSLSTVQRLPIPGSVAIGIIAAERDGKVTVAQTRLPGVTHHVSVPGMHTFVMNRADVRKLVRAFLRDGAFPEP